MAWLQKRPQVSNPQLFYTLGINRTVLIVGLGNPGSNYDLTRHNIGFFCLDHFKQANPELSDWVDKKDLKCQLSSGNLGDSRVILIKPTTYMNKSGQALAAAMNFYNLSPANSLVIHDELDINFGQIRLRLGGSAAGHNGVKSLIETIGDQFGRVRIGIGPKQPSQISSEAYVLKKFSDAEMAQLSNLSQETNAIISEYIFGGQLPSETRSFLV